MSSAESSPHDRVNVTAVVSLFAAVVLAPVGIVIAAVALRQIKRTGERGRGLALAGLGIGIAITAIVVFIVAIAVVIWALSLAVFTGIAPAL